MKIQEKLKLYVWEGDGVLEDWGTGLICVLAKNYREALKLIEKKCFYRINDFPHKKYKIIRKAEAFLCIGSS